jgi:hypothetical protein
MEDAIIPPPDVAALTAERDDLQRRLRARDGKPSFTDNVAAIKARLAEIDKELPQTDA